MRIGGSVKLADLEYAKRLDSDETHDFRTVSFNTCLMAVLVVTIVQGTHHFMACEVEAHRHLFHLKQSGNNADLDMENFSSEPAKPPFAYNPVHDLESLWWIWVWVMYFYVDKDGMTRPPEQAKAFRLLFPDYIPAERVWHFLASLQADVAPAFQHRIDGIELIRRNLEITYINMERSLPPDYALFLPRLTGYFLRALQVAVDRTGDIKLYIPVEHRKRKEPECEEGNLLSSTSNKRNKQG